MHARLELLKDEIRGLVREERDIKQRIDDRLSNNKQSTYIPM